MHYIVPQTRFIIPTELKIGDSAEFGTLQRYVCCGFDKTQGGKTSIKWQSHCKACGTEFFTYSGFTTSGVNRNCEEHKRIIKYKVRERKAKESNKPKAQEVVRTLDVKAMKFLKPILCDSEGKPLIEPINAYATNELGILNKALRDTVYDFFSEEHQVKLYGRG